MRMLLAALHPPGGSLAIGGVQSWIETVGAELASRGHDIVVWGPEWPAPNGRFDAGILAHWSHTRSVASACDRILVVSHGVIEEEQPPVGVPVAFTSEGVREHWCAAGPVVRQPIDLDFWTPAGGAEPVLVRYSYRGGLPWLQGVAGALGLGFRYLRAATHREARAALRTAACVVATGRAALEAMACGVPVVIADDREYQGPLVDFDVTGAMARNYSGRGGVESTSEATEQAIREAIERGSLREHVVRHHNAASVVDQLLEMTCCT